LAGADWAAAAPPPAAGADAWAAALALGIANNAMMMPSAALPVRRGRWDRNLVLALMFDLAPRVRLDVAVL
jgi:hypothetical protein